MHHIAFEVEDVEEVKRKYEAEGMKLLEESAVPGAGGIIVNFLRPRFGEMCIRDRICVMSGTMLLVSSFLHVRIFNLKGIDSYVT